jgi:hypothetical protein
MEPARKTLLDQVRDAIRLKHYSIRTERAYVDWIKRYIYFHNVRQRSKDAQHPRFYHPLGRGGKWRRPDLV